MHYIGPGPFDQCFERLQTAFLYFALSLMVATALIFPSDNFWAGYGLKARPINLYAYALYRRNAPMRRSQHVENPFSTRLPRTS